MGLMTQMKKHLCWTILMLWAISMPASKMMAQVIVGHITGRVVDASGAVIPNATITITAAGTGYTYSTKSTSSGNYTFEAVNPGSYALRVEAAGFESFVVKDAEVHTQTTLTLNAALKVGSTAEQITVTSATPLLQQEDAALGQLLTGQQINDMPLAGRDFTQLSLLAAGTITGTGSSTTYFTTMGTNSEQNDFRLNGIDDNEEMFGGGQVQGVSGNGQTAVVPPPDAIGEVNVQTGNFSAEFGHSTGSVVNAQIKSGTNALHGALWEYARNTLFNANSFADKYSAPIVDRQPYHENQFGFTVGGPVLLPKLYDGRNKTFFFVSWQDSRISTPSASFSSVPTPTMVSSGYTDFRDYLNSSYIGGTKSDVLGRKFPNATIFDPTTMRLVPAGTTDPVSGLQNIGGYDAYVSDPFFTGGSVGGTKDFTGLTQYLNQLPAGRIDPNAVKLLGVYPGANRPNTGTQNYFRSASSTNDLSQLDLRFDQRFGDKNIFFGTYDESNNNRFVPSPFPGIADGGGYGTGTVQGPRYGISLGYTHVFTPTLTNEIHGGWMHSVERLSSINGNTLGIPQEYNIPGVPQEPGNGGLPSISDGFTGIGGAGYVPTLQTVRSLEVMDNLTKIFSKHILKVGYQLNNITAPIIQPPQGNGSLYYSGQYTDIPNQSNGTTAYADMLLTPANTQYAQYGGVNNLGGVTQNYITSYTESYYHHLYMGAYVQDDWKVTSKLTVNLGLRWDLTTPYYDIHGHAANFIQDGGGAGTTATYVIAHDGCNTTLSPAFTQLLQQDGIKLACSANNVMNHYQHWNFAPRLGFAYSLTPKTVVRGGYGIAYGALDNLGYGPLGQNYPFLPQYYNYSFVSQTPNTTPDGATVTMENAFAAPGILSSGTTPAYALEGTGFAGRAFNLKTNYQETANFTFQHQLTTHDVFSIGYAGTFGRHLDSYGQNNTTAKFAPPGTNIYDPNSPVHIPFTDFGVGQEQTDDATSSYNSMQAIYQHQFAYGIDLSANWTWSKCMSDQESPSSQKAGGGSYRAEWLPGFGIKGDWGLCGYDAARVTHISGTWHLPVGRGKQFLSQVNRLTDTFIGGWSTNLIYLDQSGQPITIGCPQATSANFGCWADRVPGVSVYAHGRNINHWLNPDAFTQPPAATVVGQTDYSPLGGKPAQARGPAFQNIDASLFKQFEVRGATKFEFRAEAFNVGNWAQWSAPSYLNFSDTENFGKITGTRNNNRIMQLALKLYY